MCVEVLVNGEIAETRRQLRAAIGADLINAPDYDIPGVEIDRYDFCLCSVDLDATAAAAGFNAEQGPWGVCEFTPKVASHG